jgi:hypothetical protein
MRNLFGIREGGPAGGCDEVRDDKRIRKRLRRFTQWETKCRAILTGLTSWTSAKCMKGTFS